MKNVGIAVLLALGISGSASAATPLRFVFANHHCDKPVASEPHRSGYVSFAAGQEGIQATVSTTRARGASPFFKTFQVIDTTHTAGIHHLVGGLPETGFTALHGYSNLSEAIDFYWDTFTGFGYAATLESFSPESSVYLFDSGAGELRAEFVMQGDDILVSVTPVPVLVAGR